MNYLHSFMGLLAAQLVSVAPAREERRLQTGGNLTLAGQKPRAQKSRLKPSQATCSALPQTCSFKTLPPRPELSSVGRSLALLGAEYCLVPQSSIIRISANALLRAQQALSAPVEWGRLRALADGFNLGPQIWRLPRKLAPLIH